LQTRETQKQGEPRSPDLGCSTCHPSAVAPARYFISAFVSQPARHPAPAPSFEPKCDRVGSFQTEAKREVQPPLSSGLVPAWDLAAGFTAGAKGKSAALDRPGSPARGADGSRGCGGSVSDASVINTLNYDNNNCNSNYLAPAHTAYDMNDSFQVCGRGGKIRSSAAWGWGNPRPCLLLRETCSGPSTQPSPPYTRQHPKPPPAIGSAPGRFHKDSVGGERFGRKRRRGKIVPGVGPALRDAEDSMGGGFTQCEKKHEGPSRQDGASSFPRSPSEHQQWISCAEFDPRS